MNGMYEPLKLQKQWKDTGISCALSIFLIESLTHKSTVLSYSAISLSMWTCRKAPFY